METVVEVRLDLICFKGLAGRSSYLLYHDMRGWLRHRKVTHKFGWNNTGNYIPNYLTLDRESAVAFRLVYNI